MSSSIGMWQREASRLGSTEVRESLLQAVAQCKEHHAECRCDDRKIQKFYSAYEIETLEQTSPMKAAALKRMRALSFAISGQKEHYFFSSPKEVAILFSLFTAAAVVCIPLGPVVWGIFGGIASCILLFALQDWIVSFTGQQVLNHYLDGKASEISLAKTFKQYCENQAVNEDTIIQLLTMLPSVSLASDNPSKETIKKLFFFAARHQCYGVLLYLSALNAYAWGQQKEVKDMLDSCISHNKAFSEKIGAIKTWISQ